MPVIDRVRQTIRHHGLVPAGARVVVAVSGGSDSVALAHVMGDLAAAGELSVAGLAHFNHRLRARADADEQFCRDAAASLGWPIDVERDDVAARARRERRSVEDAARTARYEFLERARVRLDAGIVALGHTRDDQAETFLLRLIRGAGARGLAAIHPRVGCVVRPLLDCRRQELRAYLNAKQVPWIEDESNEDVSIPRNRIRAELVPLLETRFNPSIVDVLADEAALARDEWRWLEAAVDDVFASACRRDGLVWRLGVAALLGMPAALRRSLVRRAVTQAAAGRPVSYRHVEAALDLLEPGTRLSGVDLPGQRAQRTALEIVLTGREPGSRGRPADRPAPFFLYSLSIPGRVLVAEAGCELSAELPAGSEVSAGAAPDSTVALVRADKVGKGLAVRNRRPGDRFRQIGLGGRKRLQDFFVDRKVERAGRDLVPLVVDERDRIVWVAGWAVDEEFRVTDPTQAVVILRLKKVLGGRA